MNKTKPDISIHREQLKKYFLSLYPNTDLNELTELVEQFTIDKFPKKQMILKAGDFSDTVYFVFDGLVRIYLSLIHI